MTSRGGQVGGRGGAVVSALTVLLLALTSPLAAQELPRDTAPSASAEAAAESGPPITLIPAPIVIIETPAEEATPAPAAGEAVPPAAPMPATPPPAATAPLPAPAAAPPAADDLQRLRVQLDELTRTLARQERELARLREGEESAAADLVRRIELGFRLLESQAAGWWRDLAAALGQADRYRMNVALPAGALLLLMFVVLLTRKRQRETRQMEEVLALAAPVTEAPAAGGRPAVPPDFLARMLESFDPGLRRRWAARMAGRADAPRDLMAAFAADRIEIAEPILRESSALDEPMLLDLTRRLGTGHLRALAQRRDLPASVAAALARTGKVDVVAALLRNRTARIAEPTLATLVEASRFVDTYREPLARRPDLSPRLAWRLYDWVAAPLREAIQNKFQASQVETATEPATDDAATDTAAPTPQRLVELLRTGDLGQVLDHLCAITGLKPAQMRRILEAPDGGQLAVLCRALDFEPSRFAWIYLRVRRLLPGGRAVAPAELARAVASHAELSPKMARSILAGWQTRASA